MMYHKKVRELQLKERKKSFFFKRQLKCSFLAKKRKLFKLK